MTARAVLLSGCALCAWAGCSLRLPTTCFDGGVCPASSFCWTDGYCHSKPFPDAGQRDAGSTDAGNRGDAGADAGALDGGPDGGLDAGVGCLFSQCQIAARLGASATVDFYGAAVFVGGLSANGAASGETDLFDTVLDFSTWRSIALPTGQAFGGIFSVHDIPLERRLVVFGGVDSTGGAGASWSANFGKSELVCDLWQQWTSLPVGRRWLAVPIGDDVALGGFYLDGGYSPSDLVDAFDGSSPPGAWSSMPPMPTARGALGAVALGQNRILAVGGQGQDDAGSSVVLGAVELWDPDAGWSTLPSLPTARAGLALSLGADGWVYAIGGSTTPLATPLPTAVVEVFNPATGTWDAGPPLPEARWGAAAALGSPVEAQAPTALVVFGGALPDGGLAQETLTLVNGAWVPYSNGVSACP